MELESGHSLGRYKIEARLGKGGFGTVYAAYDTLLQRRVALKVLGAIGDERARLVAEARAAARLVHPNVVTVHEVESDGDVTYLVMELVPGLTLRKRAATASVAQKIEWLAQIADALGAAHAAGLVHRDVKPDNVVIGEATGTAKVLDFGIAKAFDPPPTLAGGGPFSGIGAPPPTATGKVVGTLRYMAPEQLLGHPVGPPVDQWAWGVLAYEVLTGQHPGVVSGASTPEEWILLGHTRPIDEVVPGIPANVAAAVGRALARDPRARFASMAEVATALRAPATPVSTGGATPMFHASQPTAPTAIVQHAAVAPSFSSGHVAPMPSTQSGGIQGPLPPAQAPPPAYVAAPGPFPASHTMPAAVHAPPRRGVPGWAIGLGALLLLLGLLGAGAAAVAVFAHANGESAAVSADAEASPKATSGARNTPTPSATLAVGVDPSATASAASTAGKGGPAPPLGVGTPRADGGVAAPSPSAAPGAACKDDCDCAHGVCSGLNGGTCIACPAGQVGAHTSGGPGVCGPPCTGSPSSEECPPTLVCRGSLGDRCAGAYACVPPSATEQRSFDERRALWNEMHAAYPTHDAYARAVQQVSANPDGSCPKESYRSGGACLASCLTSSCKHGATCFATGQRAKDGTNRPLNYCKALIDSWDWAKAPRLR